jgi:hypothetical protein
MVGMCAPGWSNAIPARTGRYDIELTSERSRLPDPKGSAGVNKRRLERKRKKEAAAAEADRATVGSDGLPALPSFVFGSRVAAL